MRVDQPQFFRDEFSLGQEAVARVRERLSLRWMAELAQPSLFEPIPDDPMRRSLREADRRAFLKAHSEHSRAKNILEYLSQ